MDHQPKKRNERSISVNFAQEGLTTPKRQRRAKRPVRVDLVGQSESVTPRTPAPKSYGIDCSWINDQALTFVAWPWHRLGAAQRRELG